MDRAADVGSVIYSRGARRAGLVDHGTPPASSRAARWQVPPGADPLVGREADLERLSALIDGEERGPHGLLSLVGVGGVGKTRLAREFANRLASRFPDGSVLVPVDEIANPHALPSLLESALGLIPGDNRDALDHVVEHLREHPVLILLDNCEHLVNECAELVARVIHGAPDTFVLATSQEALRLPEERVYSVGPLTLDASLELFVQHARRRHPGFSLDASTREAVTRITGYVGGTPLGVVLAAAWTDTLSGPAIADQITTLDLRGVPPRQRSLWKSVLWSYELLSPEHRSALRASSVFAGGFTVEAARAVCGTAVRPERVDRVLAGLTAKSLLIRDHAAPETRFRHIEHVRHFLATRLAQNPSQAHVVRRAHTQYFAELAQTTEPLVALRDDPAVARRYADRPDTLRRLHAEENNFRAAVDWAEAHDQPLFEQLCLGLWAYWSLYGLEEGRRALETLLQRPALSDHARAAALSATGEIARYQGDLSRAVDCQVDCLALCERLGDSAGIAYACNNLGDALFESGRWADAQRSYRRALHLRRKLGLTAGVAYTLNNLARVASSRNRAARSATLQSLAMVLFDSIDHEVGLATVALNSAASYLSIGWLDMAEDSLRQALAIKTRHDDHWAAAIAIEGLAVVAGRRGERPKAEQLVRLATALRDADGMTGPSPWQSELQAIGPAASNRSAPSSLSHESILAGVHRILGPGPFDRSGGG